MGNTVMPLQFQCLELQRCKCKQDKYVHRKGSTSRSSQTAFLTVAGDDQTKYLSAFEL